MAFAGGGNPRYGRDGNGTAPPTAQRFQPPPYQYNMGAPQSRLYYSPAPPAMPAVPAGWPPYTPYAPAAAAAAWPPTNQVFVPPGVGVGGAHVLPQTSHRPALAQGQGPPPPLSREFRNCSMRNTTGGFGCEPGYNYFFPAKHTKIHVLQTGATPPWQLPANFAIQFHACHVPVNTTVAELMKGFGAKNSIPKLNVITEVCPGGGGKWYKGIEVSGESFDMLKKPIKELGWDETRTGLRGEKKVVYIYVQRG